MGVDLVGHGSEESFNWAAWRALYQIAISFGWKPAGTLPPEGFVGEWNAGYFSNDLQAVTDADALAMGKALNRALKEEFLTVEQASDLHGMSKPIRRLADFCSRGGFLIF